MRGFLCYYFLNMYHVIKSQQFNRDLLQKIFLLADKLEKKPDSCMRGKIMASLFYEPSTRTRFSFESAMLRLGGSIITTENAREFSSVIKGETLEDTVKVINSYADLIVLRHPEKGAAKRAAVISKIPVINAGDGTGQHPTQALLDIYTIKRERRHIDGTIIAMVGDLKNGRTVRSLAYMLGKYKDIKIYFVSPKELRIGNDIKQYLKKHKIDYTEIDTITPVLKKVDVLYQTRIQKERFKSSAERKKFKKNTYQISLETVTLMKPKSIIMHPLPRVEEILPEVDTSKKAVYFKQAHYGLLIRMALLKLIFD